MIIFKNVSKRFSDDSTALDDISFQVEKGEFIFLTGHSGSGKSTLLKILTKEYTPSSGEVEFEGEPLHKIKGSRVHHHRRKIGVVFQDYRLLPELNVWENIALALQISGRPQNEIEERVTDLLDLVQLTEKAFNFPAQLSGGEAQRVGIARALATAPSILLADEPTGNLDPQTTNMIARLFSKIHELGTTIVLATHDLAVLQAYNYRRLHLEKGRLVSDTGKPSDTPSDPPGSMPPTPPETPPVTQVMITTTTTQETVAEPPATTNSTTPTPKESSTKPAKAGFSFANLLNKLPFKQKKSEEKSPPSSSTYAEVHHLSGLNEPNRKDDEPELESAPRQLRQEKIIERNITQMLIQVENLDDQ